MKHKLEWIDVFDYDLFYNENSEMFSLQQDNGDVIVTGNTVSSCIDKLYAQQVTDKVVASVLKDCESHYGGKNGN